MLRQAWTNKYIKLEFEIERDKKSKLQNSHNENEDAHVDSIAPNKGCFNRLNSKKRIAVQMTK